MRPGCLQPPRRHGRRERAASPPPRAVTRPGKAQPAAADNLTDLDSAPCKFPDCAEPASLAVAPGAHEAFFLGAEHRELLVDDPGEFRRRWGAISLRAAAGTP